MKPRVDIDIARNIKTIEWLKTEMLGGVADLFRNMREGDEDAVVDQLAHVTVTAYVLGRRLGVGFSRLDEAVREKVRMNIRHGHDFEEWYGDFSSLDEHLNLE